MGRTIWNFRKALNVARIGFEEPKWEAKPPRIWVGHGNWRYFDHETKWQADFHGFCSDLFVYQMLKKTLIPRTKLRVHSECGIHQFPFIMARIPIAGRLWASSGLVIRVAMAGWPNNAKPPVPFFTPAVTVPGVPFFWVPNDHHHQSGSPVSPVSPVTSSRQLQEARGGPVPGVPSLRWLGEEGETFLVSPRRRWLENSPTSAQKVLLQNHPKSI